MEGTVKKGSIIWEMLHDVDKFDLNKKEFVWLRVVGNVRKISKSVL